MSTDPSFMCKWLTSRSHRSTLGTRQPTYHVIVPSDRVRALFSYFSGFSKKDVAWLHVPSKTLIVADLIFNLPATEQYSKSSSSGKLPFFIPKFEPTSSFHKKFVWDEGKDKE